MSSITSIVARQVRYRQWAEEVRECNNRPRGVKVEEWCREHGITKSAYYSRLKVLRRLSLESLHETENSTMPAEMTPGRFIELPLSICTNADNQISPVTIRLGKSEIIINENISDSFLVRIMEAVSHVK